MSAEPSFFFLRTLRALAVLGVLCALISGCAERSSAPGPPGAGGGTFYVTTGLLQKATDPQLVGVLAHELAHDDLGHVAKAQVVRMGISIGMVILDQLIPGSGVVTPIAGNLVARAYSRNEEYAADRHGSDILTRAGYPPATMIETLTWLMSIEGAAGGGFFASHPATADRIQALRGHQ